MDKLHKKKFIYPEHTSTKHSLLWVVNIKSMGNVSKQAHQVACDLDLVNLGQFRDFQNHFIFAHEFSNAGNSSLTIRKVHSLHLDTYNESEFESLVDFTEGRLEAHADVLWFSHQRILSRQKRDIKPFMNFVDPLYPQQWHLVSNFV